MTRNTYPLISTFLLILLSPVSAQSADAGQTQLEQLTIEMPSMTVLLGQLGWWWMPILALLGLVCLLMWQLWHAGEKSFQKNSFRWNVLSVIGVVLIVLIINTVNYLQEYQRNSFLVQQQILDHSKKLLKHRVDFIIDFIEEEKKYARVHLEKELKFRVDQAYNTAEAMVTGSEGPLNQQSLTRLVVEALRPVRHRNGRGYMFATRMDGTELLFADHPELEGTNILDMQDLDGMLFVREMVRLSRVEGGGYVSYRISKPGSSSWDHRKLSYVRYFAPLDFFIGTGEYLEDFEKENRTRISERLEALQFSGALTIFGVNYNGVELFGPGQGRNMYEATDRNGVKVVQELIAAAKQGGGFVRYHMPESVDKKQYPKLSYSKPIPGWDSYIGAGINLETLEIELVRSHAQLQQLFKRQSLETAFLLPIIAVVLLLLGRRFASRINRSVSILESSLDRAAEQDVSIDTDQIEFKEFVHIADSANRMLKERQLASHEVLAREENLSVTLDSIGDAVVVTDTDGRVTRMNPVAEKLTGWKSDEAVGQKLSCVFNIINSNTREQVANPVQKVLDSGQVVGLATHTVLIARSGCEYQIADSAAPIRSSEFGIQGVVLVFRDVTEEYTLTQALHESEERFRTMFDNAPLMVALLDTKGSPLFVNEQLSRMTGYSSEDLLKQCFCNMISPSAKSAYTDCFEKVVSGKERVCRLDSSYTESGGGVLEVDQSLAVIYGPDGRVRYVLLMAKDITERVHHEKRLEWLGMHDDLTGLANRAKLMQVIDQLLSGTDPNQEYWLLLNDLDRFKNINDNYGHATGDQFLRDEGQRLQQFCPEGGLAARLSGDEFVIVAPFENAEAVNLFAENLQRKICEPIECNGIRLQVATSTGIAAVVGVSASEVLRRADLAMYQAKRSEGSGGIQVYNEQMNEVVMSRQRLESDIKAALETPGQFLMYYQPIWSQEQGALRGFEALIRWDHPTRGRVMPNEFIPLAEESELIVVLGKTVLRLACRDIGIWLERYPELAEDDFRVSINLSPQHLMTVDLVDEIRVILDEYGVPAHNLCLEITETAIMEDPAVAAKRINALKDLGLHVAIDDFGTGYSSLSYLNQFNVDIIKLDRSLTQGIDTASTSFKVSSAVIQLAHDLNLRVVAEGVETTSQLEMLDQLGCDFIQGYLTGRPMPMDDVWIQLQDRRCEILKD